MSSDKGGWISADIVKGCWPLTITVTHTGIRSGQLQIDFLGDPNNPYSNFVQDNTPPASVFLNTGERASYTYNEPGEFLVRAIDLSGTTGGLPDRTAILPIEVLEKEGPFYRINTCANNAVALTLILDSDTSTPEIENSFDEFIIDFGDGSPLVTVQKPEVGPPFTLNEYHTYTSTGPFFISVSGKIDNGDVSFCPVEPTLFTPVQNLLKPSLNLVKVVNDQRILFSYENLDNRFTYTLQIDRGTGFQDYLRIDPFENPNELEIDDSGLNANQESYDFRIRISDLCGTTENFSQIVTSIALNASLAEITNSFQFEFNWVIRPSSFIEANLINDNIVILHTTNNTGLEQVSFRDCVSIGTFSLESIFNGVLSQSQSLRPLENLAFQLPGPPPPNPILNGNIVSLSFDPTDFALGEIQILRRGTNNTYEQIGTESELNGTFLDLTIPPGLSEACYRITYTDECGNLSEQSTEACIELVASLRLPNAFSPNGDNVNDTFVAGGGVFNNYQMLVYNRWGDLVFQTTDSTVGWDGTIGSSNAPAGSYLYRVSYTNADNFTVKRNGTVALIR